MLKTYKLHSKIQITFSRDKTFKISRPKNRKINKMKIKQKKKTHKFQ